MSQKILGLQNKEVYGQNKKLHNAYNQLSLLLTELEEKELTEEVVIEINTQVKKLNNFSGTHKQVKKQLVLSLRNILKILREKLRIVPKNYYRNIWMALGIASFGVPIGVAIGTALGNMGFIGVGIGMGLPIGLAIGIGLDKKAYDEGRQLNFEERF